MSTRVFYRHDVKRSRAIRREIMASIDIYKQHAGVLLRASKRVQCHDLDARPVIRHRMDGALVVASAPLVCVNE